MAAFFLLFLLCFRAHADPAGPRAAALQARINAAIASSAAEVAFGEGGDYYFNSESLLVQGARDLTILGHPNATLWFEMGSGVRVDRCFNVTVRGQGVKIDYDPPVFFQATAVSDAVPHGTGNGILINISTDPGFLDPDTFYNLYHDDPKNEYVQGPQWFAGDAGAGYPLISAGWQDFNPPRDMTPSGAPGMFTYRIKNPPPRAIKKGDKVTAVVRIGYTYLVHNSTRIASSDVTLHSASFMAITEFDGEGGHSYDNFRVVRRGVDPDARCGRDGRRLCFGAVASNGDVFHSSGVRFGPKVTHCEFSFSFDDFCNVHSRVQVTVGPAALSSGGTGLVVADPRLARDAGFADDLPYGVVETFTNVVPGMHLAFREMVNLTQVHEAVVRSVSRVPAGDALFVRANNVVHGLNNNNPKLSPAFQSFDVNGTGAPSRVWVVELEDSAKVPWGDLNNTLIDVVEWSAAGAEFAHNLLHNSTYGVRWKSNGGRIFNNSWRAGDLPLSVTKLEVTPLRAYLEGPLAITNVTIEDNVIEGHGVGPDFVTLCLGMSHRASPPFQSCSDIKVANNTFINDDLTGENKVDMMPM